MTIMALLALCCGFVIGLDELNYRFCFATCTFFVLVFGHIYFLHFTHRNQWLFIVIFSTLSLRLVKFVKSSVRNVNFTYENQSLPLIYRPNTMAISPQIKIKFISSTFEAVFLCCQWDAASESICQI